MQRISPIIIETRNEVYKAFLMNDNLRVKDCIIKKYIYIYIFLLKIL